MFRITTIKEKICSKKSFIVCNHNNTGNKLSRLLKMLPIVRKGKNNSRRVVKRIQKLLNKKIKAGLEIDGVFGPATKAAVEKFQSLHGLKPDGIVGPKTWKLLLAPSPSVNNTNISAIPPMTQSSGQGSPPPLRFARLRNLYHRNVKKFPELQFTTSGMERELEAFKKVWDKNRQRYENVAEIVNIPASLIAAIHYRESSNNFKTYLHNGDLLGKPTVHVPKGILFTEWEKAAEHAIRQKDSIRRDLGLTRHSTSMAAIAAFAERYNGLGYKGRRIFSPYVFSGTNLYKGGLFVADHKFNPKIKDRRPGILALMRKIGFQFSR
jgi:lysozyme family protein